MFLLFSVQAVATHSIPRTLTEITDGAELIVIAEVMEVKEGSYSYEQNGSYGQKVTMKIERTIKGLRRNEVMVLAKSTGRRGTKKFSAGDKYLLFLSTFNPIRSEQIEGERLFVDFSGRNSFKITETGISWYE